MSETKPSTPNTVTELKVSAHLMQLDAGVYCVSHSPGSSAPDPATGLPGARLSVPPGPNGQGVTITGFNDGWLGELDSAALVRVAQGPAQVLMTVYQHPESSHAAPRLQVTRLLDAVQSAASTLPHQESLQQTSGQLVPAGPNGSIPMSDAEVAAHVQRRGDVLARLGDWVGDQGSQRWVEGFAVSPRMDDVSPEEIEYQAVLGRGWLSPWAEGGQYCGSRGMALPILGLRVRLRGKASETHRLQVSATFTDGTSIGPLGSGDACETETLAPLEAFRIEILPIAAAVAPSPARSKAVPQAKLQAKPGKAAVAKRVATPSAPPPKATVKTAAKPRPVPAAPSRLVAKAKPVVAAAKGKPAQPLRGRAR